MDQDLKNRTRAELKEMTAQYTTKAFLGDYVFSFIHAKQAKSIQDITPLAQAFRGQLVEAGWGISKLETVETLTDPDGTVKFLFVAENGARFESVLLADADRATLCISCQSGCRMGCHFCATGQLGFKAHLNAAQIVDQVNQVAGAARPIHNVVYMGMGEPLDNVDEVIRSVHILNDPQGQNIGQRRMTISTCGLPDGIRRLADTDLQTRLAVSLHAPQDRIRDQIMPMNRRYPLEDLLHALQSYQAQTRRRITFEYCLIKGLNDSPELARMLVQRIRAIKANVNLIEFNAFPSCSFQPSDRETIRHFAHVLQGQGVETVIRYKRGQKINAACGQLGATWPRKNAHHGGA
jgi:23S rRNA (adenine2503-C2)-methyltransferase